MVVSRGALSTYSDKISHWNSTLFLTVLIVSQTMRTKFLVLTLSVFSIVVTCLESLESSDSSDDSVINDDDLNQLDSELLASDACLAQPDPNGQTRARGEKSRACPPRKKNPPTTGNLPKPGTGNSVPPKPFPIPVVRGRKGLDWEICRKASLGIFWLAICESGDPNDVTESPLSGAGWVLYRVEHAFLRKSPQNRFRLPVHLIFRSSPKQEIDQGWNANPTTQSQRSRPQVFADLIDSFVVPTLTPFVGLGNSVNRSTVSRTQSPHRFAMSRSEELISGIRLGD